MRALARESLSSFTIILPDPRGSQPDLSDSQREQLRSLLELGLPLTPQPYQTLAEQIGSSEQAVLDAVQQWQEDGMIKRLGLVVQHRALGYHANAMVVWDVPDEQVDEIGELLKSADAVTLCYRRPRRLPDWPYNLFCMVHGREREVVIRQVEALVEKFGLQHIPHSLLFSVRSYKQCGGRYTRRNATGRS